VIQNIDKMYWKMIRKIIHHKISKQIFFKICNVKLIEIATATSKIELQKVSSLTNMAWTMLVKTKKRDLHAKLLPPES